MIRSIVCMTGLLVSSAVSFADNRPVIGNMAVTLQAASIFAAPNSHSRRFCRVKEKQLLVVRPYSQVWDRVAMGNGAEGYVRAFAVNVSSIKLHAETVNRRRVEIPFEQGNPASRTGVADYALKYVGQVQYKFGGTSFDTGMDCSAFVREMYGKIGVNLPRTAAEQSGIGQPIERLELLQPGDRLYFYDAKRGMIGHTGIYEGGGFFLHNSSGKGGVAVSRLTKSWQNLLVAARR